MVLVLDVDSRPLLRKRAPAWAKEQVEQGKAVWVHAPGHEPDLGHGTIRLLKNVTPAPSEPSRATLLDCNGVAVRTLHLAQARRLRGREGAAHIIAHVGTLYRDHTPRCLLLLVEMTDVQREAFLIHDIVRLAERLADFGRVRDYVSRHLGGDTYTVHELPPNRQKQLIAEVQATLATHSPEVRLADALSGRIASIREISRLLHSLAITGSVESDLLKDKVRMLVDYQDELTNMEHRLHEMNQGLIETAGALYRLGADTSAMYRTRAETGDRHDPNLLAVLRALGITPPPTALAASPVARKLGRRSNKPAAPTDEQVLAASAAGGGRIEDDGNRQTGKGGGVRSHSTSQALAGASGQ